MKIGRRGLFGFGAAAAVAPAALVAVAKPASGYGASPFMEAAADFKEMTRLHRAYLMAVERAANPAWIVHEDGSITLMPGQTYRTPWLDMRTRRPVEKE